MAGLTTYWKKRDFTKTSEPRGAAEQKRQGNDFVIQKHDASRLHYDLRLELDGVMLSWAVTKGPSLVPGEKRLAIHVEDHPIEYNTFEGTIPQGEYGGGTVMVWDRGKWFPINDPHKGLKKGHLDFILEGKKLHGKFHLVRMKSRPGERQEAWLLIKSDDEFARRPTEPDILDEQSRSAKTGRTMDEIANARGKVWHSNRTAPSTPKKAAPAKKAKSVAKRAKPAAKKTKSAAKAKRTRTSRTKAARVTDDSDGSPAVHLDPRALPGARKAPLPEFVPPSLATLRDQAPASNDFVHEIKFDGYRMQARIDAGKCTLLTRTGLDWTHRFPHIARAAAELPVSNALIDGEIVATDASGVSDFSALQEDRKNGRTDRLAFYVFDLLYLDGYDITGAPLVARKKALSDVCSGIAKDALVRVSEHFDVPGPTLLKHACEMHLEGIISKKRDAPYRSGRSGDWIKAKCTSRQELIIAGYEPSDKSVRAIRSLVLAYYDKDGLRYAGRVGTGFTEATERDLVKRLNAIKREKSPFDPVPAEERRRNVVWVDPKVVAEIEFRGWTHGNVLRQGAFKGVRDDKPPREVVREVSTMPNETKQAALRQSTAKKTAAPRAKTTVGKGKVVVPGTNVVLTHPERVYWEDAGITKLDLAEYYVKVWKWMAPHVTRRVLALVRCPDGATAECFFQKHASAGVEAKNLHLVPEPDGDRSISIDDLDGLVSLAQAGVLEVHTRGTTVDHLEEADRLVFDLDPGPGITWKDIIAAARETRERLKALGLESFVKTTGGKGLHVVLPIQYTPWDVAKDFCRRIAEAMVADSPDRYTATVKKAARGNKIFVDYLRNSREATAIAPYSTRARPGATVSVPITWEELGKLKVPNGFTVKNLPARLSRQRKDPWADICKLKQRLPKLKKA